MQAFLHTSETVLEHLQKGNPKAMMLIQEIRLIQAARPDRSGEQQHHFGLLISHLLAVAVQKLESKSHLSQLSLKSTAPPLESHPTSA